jgi:hypothetical protein
VEDEFTSLRGWPTWPGSFEAPAFLFFLPLLTNVIEEEFCELRMYGVRGSAPKNLGLLWMRRAVGNAIVRVLAGN